jgi:predicted Zn-dependent peptidase
MGDPFDVRDPTALILQAHHPAAVDVDRVVNAAAEEIARVADDGLEQGELARIQARIASHLLREADPVLGRTLAMATFEQQRGRAELVGDLAPLVAQVTEREVADAAATLHADRRAVLELVAGGQQ